MENYKPLCEIFELLEKMYKNGKYSNLIDYCKKLLEKTRLENKFTPEDIIQEASLKLLTSTRKIGENINFTKSMYLTLKSIIYNHSHHFNDIITEVRESFDINENSSFDLSLIKNTQTYEIIEAEELEQRLLENCGNDEEKLILLDMIKSMNNKQIAEDLGLSESKVKVIRRNLKQKLAGFDFRSS